MWRPLTGRCSFAKKAVQSYEFSALPPNYFLKYFCQIAIFLLISGEISLSGMLIPLGGPGATILLLMYFTRIQL